MKLSTSASVQTLCIPITFEEREELETYLTQSRTGLIGAIKGLSDAQWTFAPSPVRWSIAQVVEHVNCIFGRLLGPVKDNVAQGPPPDLTRDYKHIDAIVFSRFPAVLPS